MTTEDQLIYDNIHAFLNNNGVGKGSNITISLCAWLIKEYAKLEKMEYLSQSKQPHDCHGKGYEVKGNVIYCRECNEPLFEIIGYKNQKHL